MRMNAEPLILLIDPNVQMSKYTAFWLWYYGQNEAKLSILLLSSVGN
jgi:hypothetical protein